MKKVLFPIFSFTLIFFGSNAQLKKLNIREKIGDMAGNLMTAKTAELEQAVAKTSFICGIYPPGIKTSESKYFPKDAREGDYIMSISFMKNGGVGMYEIQGDITCNGTKMEYVGLGSYMVKVKKSNEAKTIEIKTTTGDQAKLVVKPIPEIEIISINGDNTLPILDLSKDIVIEYTNPPGSEGSRIRVSLITDVAGAKALNHFSDFPAGKDPIAKVTIPKEALSNPEIAGSLKGVGNYNKGENHLIIERVVTTEKDKMGSEQNLGNLFSAELKSLSYASKPVIVKGQQDEKVFASMHVTGRTLQGAGFEFYKPNANSGIPFSQGSKFGLVSFVLTGKTFKEESESYSNSWTVGNTRYSQTTVKTTTYQFPQLSDKQWTSVMDGIYKEVVKFFETEYKISFVPVEKITGTANYATLFPAEQANTEEKIKINYKGTQRFKPQKLGEIFKSISSNNTSDVPVVNMMKEADVDGLVCLYLDLQVGGDKDDHVVLLPRLSFSIIGRDEKNSNKQGTYVDGFITNNGGVPFSEKILKSADSEVYKTCSGPQLIEGLQYGIKSLRNKEIELGYDKIWSTGQ